jgi:DnaK suppressor protein
MMTKEISPKPIRPAHELPPRLAAVVSKLLDEQNQIYYTLMGTNHPGIEVRDSWDVRELESESSTTEVERRRRERLFERLREIDGALDRVGAGTYGLCVECGDEISVKRLELNPATRLCVACQARAEGSRSHPSL